VRGRSDVLFQIEPDGKLAIRDAMSSRP